MKKDRRTWWRIVTGCILLLAVAANVALYAVWKWDSNGDLVRVGPRWVVDLTYTGTGPANLIRREANARLAQVGPIQTETRGPTIRVILPLGSQQAYEAHEAFEREMAKLESAGVDLRILRTYVGEAERPRVSIARVHATDATVDGQLAEIAAEHPAKAKGIAAAAAAYKRFVDRNGGLLDPDQLLRRLNRNGKLEFRIAPTAPDTGGTSALSEADYTRYVNRLVSEGPDPGNENRSCVWLPIREGPQRLNTQLVTERFAGRRYLLVANRPEQAMLHRRGSVPWSVSAYPGSDALGRPAVHFELDPQGGRLIRKLTIANTGNYMAIVVDDEVYSAPVIRAAIGGSGIIEGTFTRGEVSEMVVMLNRSGLFGAGVRFSADSVMTRSGSDPPKAGTKHATLWALGVTAVVLLAIWLVAMAGGRLQLACLAALLVPLSAVAFWQVVQWSNFAARGLGIVSPITNGVFAVVLAGIWVLAAALGRRRRPPVLSPVEQPIGVDN